MKKIITMIFITTAPWISNSAWAINCSAKSSSSEKIICNSPELSHKDSILNEKYRTALLITTNKESLINQQRSWLKNYRDKCKDSTCLAQVYSKRVSEVEELIYKSAQTCTIQEPMLTGSWNGIRDAEFDTFELNKDHLFNSWRNERPEYSDKKWEFDSKTCQLHIFSGEDKLDFKYHIIIMPNKQLVTIRQSPIESSVYKKIQSEK
ncbi:lysozyme inhibitor LprI family protein [Chromobacterium violaceum]|uniref:lysozyme inhibitor LprI family protein n=1 Tax=Chromobacterium violaceum TaxID=536 RepID=UPI003858D502